MAINKASKMRFEISRVVHDNSFSMKAPHTHTYYEIFFLVSGRCHLYIDNEKYTLSPGDIAFIKPGHPHKTMYSLGIQSERVCLEFSEEYLAGLNTLISWDKLYSAIEYPIFSAMDSESEALNKTFDILLGMNNINSKYSKEILKLTLFQMIFLIIGCKKTISSETTQKRYTANTEKALEYIHLNYDKKISLTDISKNLHLNSSYFSKLFKDEVGKGFAEYVLDLRLVKAEDALLETKKTVTEIALSCGFGNSNYFCEAFRKKNHISPSEFRRIKGNII